MSIEKLGLDPDERLGLNKDDVISCPISDFGVQGMTKLGLLLAMIDAWTQKSTIAGEYAWFTDGGRECEILRVNGGGWQKGRFRFRLEFIPNNPAAFNAKPPNEEIISPLDDLRSNLEV